ncbi:MAG: hypothetical protein FVQ81_15740 [Candidatus Glassbacteria bacterium]|nr:hypothetical protein [Candidatus Glassbacteria bacterium]
MRVFFYYHDKPTPEIIAPVIVRHGLAAAALPVSIFGLEPRLAILLGAVLTGIASTWVAGVQIIRRIRRN